MLFSSKEEVMPNKGQQVSQGGQSNKSRKKTTTAIQSTRTGKKAQSKFKPPRPGRATSSGTAAKGRTPQVSTLGAEDHRGQGGQSPRRDHSAPSRASNF